MRSARRATRSIGQHNYTRTHRQSVVRRTIKNAPHVVDRNRRAWRQYRLQAIVVRNLRTRVCWLTAVGGSSEIFETTRLAEELAGSGSRLHAISPNQTYPKKNRGCKFLWQFVANLSQLMVIISNNRIVNRNKQWIVIVCRVLVLINNADWDKDESRCQ